MLPFQGEHLLHSFGLKAQHISAQRIALGNQCNNASGALKGQHKA
jgi:hypothetical protein